MKLGKYEKCATCVHNAPRPSWVYDPCIICKCGDLYRKNEEKKQIYYVPARGGGRSYLDGLMIKHCWLLDGNHPKFTYGRTFPSIEKVIFNDPATIVMWSDGTKTVVKAEGEDFDKEKGLAMAISKKALGNQGNYYEEFKKWIPEEKKSQKTIRIGIIGTQNVEEAIAKIFGEPVPNQESEIMPYGCNKSVCTGKCDDCCPAHTGCKRNAGPKCKGGCPAYDEAFE